MSKKTIQNAEVKPRVYFGLHMAEGVAEYTDAEVNDGKPYRIFIGEKTLKNMDSTFQGCPLYVLHREEEDIESADQAIDEKEVDGWVVRSFFNRMDGKHWAEFIITTDRGHAALAKGWTLSNAYLPEQTDQGGQWHSVSYLREVTSAKYNHLALVPNPRYQESVVLTPEEFKAYNEKKELELKLISNSNSNKENSSMSPKFNFFKRAVVENSAATDLEGTLVTLPKSKKDMSIADLITNMDEAMMPDAYANGDHKVKVGDDEMTVNELVAKHLEMKGAKNEDEADADAHAAEESGEGEMKANEEEEEDDKAAKAKKSNSKKPAKKAVKNAKAEEESEEESEDDEDHFTHLMNAKGVANAGQEEAPVEMTKDQVERGKSRYGSA